MRDELLVFSWFTEKEKRYRFWHPWETIVENDDRRILSSIFELPNDVGRPIRITNEVGPPVIRSVFDVYLLGNRLIYFKQPCRPDDNDARFFLHVVPADKRDLSQGRRKYGFDALGFRMEEYTRVGRRCTAVRRLPDYPIAEIRTGQFTDEGRLWEGTVVIDGSGSDERPPP